jgi:hypothetical protein
MHPPEKAGLVGWLARWSLNPTTFQRRSRALKPGKLMLKFAKIAQPNPSLPLPLVYAETDPPVMSFFCCSLKNYANLSLSRGGSGTFLSLTRC